MTTRREFIQRSVAGATVLGGLSLTRAAYAQGNDLIKVGLVGCGGRGGGAAVNILENVSHPNVKLVACADAFSSCLEGRLSAIARRCGDKVDVPPERRFVGLDAYKKLMETDVDIVLLCSPPGFRPAQFEAAVAAGKHAFLEKPVATDGPGTRRVAAANEIAKQKGLAVAVGHHLRHEKKHIEPIERIRNGEIGEVLYYRAFFNSGGVWVRPRKPDQTEMEHQVSNWYYFNWLSGDHIVEQHVHDLDVCNWMAGAHPVEAQGVGGRQVRVGPNYGEIYDHHTVEYTYADGTRMFSFCRHMPGCWGSFSEHAYGSNGSLSISGHGTSTLSVEGKDPVSWRRDADGHQTEMDDLMAALIAGEPYNEGKHGVEGTMTAILGRMATYSGKIVTWDEAMASELDLHPETLAFDATPKVLPGPDGIYPCAIPGKTKAF